MNRRCQQWAKKQTRRGWHPRSPSLSQSIAAAAADDVTELDQYATQNLELEKKMSILQKSNSKMAKIYFSLMWTLFPFKTLVAWIQRFFNPREGVYFTNLKQNVCNKI